VLLRPLRKCILISHTLVTSATDDNQIIQNCWPALGFGQIMAALKVEYRDGIATPRSSTFSLEGVTYISYPQLFSYGLGYLDLLCHPMELLSRALD
jgi:hypothetical protein